MYLDPEGEIRAGVVFDNLIHRGEMPVTIGVFVDPGQPGNRNAEYDAFDDIYAAFLLREILPAVQDGHLITDDPDRWDLAIAWTYFRGESREAFGAGLAFDDGTWARGRGWALWKALITRAHVVQGGTNAVDAAGRFGWPGSSRATLGEVLANG